MDNAIDQPLYKQVVKEAKKKFESWPSAYASMWVQKRYQELGGEYTKKDTGLKNWRRENWIQILPLLKDGKVVACGDDNKETKACRPAVRVNKDTPITISELLELHSVDDIIAAAEKKNANMSKRLNWKKLTLK
mgnify:CR=1 FL=1|jgi:hypothetical protein|tara:strand:- start:334 stop:735 length:402 start_codon:yes stop_codon:yes gene_type:complete